MLMTCFPTFLHQGPFHSFENCGKNLVSVTVMSLVNTNRRKFQGMIHGTNKWMTGRYLSIGTLLVDIAHPAPNLSVSLPQIEISVKLNNPPSRTFCMSRTQGGSPASRLLSAASSYFLPAKKSMTLGIFRNIIVSEINAHLYIILFAIITINLL